MRLIVGLLICLSLGALTQALASDQASQNSRPPTQPASAGEPAPATRVTPASPAASANSQAAAAATATATTTKAPPASARSRKPPELTQAEKDLLARGYKLEMRGPDKHFCRNETSLGTRFTKKVCVTPQEVTAAEANAQDATRQSQRVGFDYIKGGISPSGHP